METLRHDIESFVAAALQPALLDPGEEPLPLVPECWSLTEWNGKLVIQAWDAKRTLVRRIVGMKDVRRHRLSFITERFPKTRGETQIADLAAPDSLDIQRRTSRTAFRDRFALMLAREFPQWKVEEVSAEANLEESLTPTFTRAFLRMGSMGIAAMASPPDAVDTAGIVPAGLIWLDYLRRREKAFTIGQFILFVPMRGSRETSFRAALLNPERVALQLFAYDERDRAGMVELADAGNVESSLPPARHFIAPNLAPPTAHGIAGVDRVEHSDGSISFQVRGLEFARWSNGKIFCGVGRKRRGTLETLEATAREVVRVRDAATLDRQHPLYTRSPEGWMESQVRANPAAIDAALLPVPIYGQVPVFGGSDRGIIDLLGVDHGGRLVVIELKATADHQLPFQALDYWLRVRKHLLAGDFERLGYFPGVTLSRENPRILLVAPALQFHSTSEGLIGYLSPHCQITRVGLAADWRSELRVMFRLNGADRP